MLRAPYLSSPWEQAGGWGGCPGWCMNFYLSFLASTRASYQAWASLHVRRWYTGFTRWKRPRRELRPFSRHPQTSSKSRLSAGDVAVGWSRAQRAGACSRRRGSIPYCLSQSSTSQSHPCIPKTGDVLSLTSSQINSGSHLNCRLFFFLFLFFLNTDALGRTSLGDCSAMWCCEGRIFLYILTCLCGKGSCNVDRLKMYRNQWVSKSNKR